MAVPTVARSLLERTVRKAIANNGLTRFMNSNIRSLTALPIYNEARHVGAVLDEVLRYSQDVLVVDDGSTDGTSDLLAGRRDLHVVRHPRNRGYGAALRKRVQFRAVRRLRCAGDDRLRRPASAAADSRIRGCLRQTSISCRAAGICNSSTATAGRPKRAAKSTNKSRRKSNCRLGLHLTDAFCGFKAYSVPALAKLDITETGYAMPLELWVQAAQREFKIVELPVPLIYLEEARSFGGSLDDSQTRLRHYQDVIDRSVAALRGPVPRRFRERAACSSGAR